MILEAILLTVMLDKDVDRCAEQHPWTRVGERTELVWCVAHVYDAPGAPREAVEVARCESGVDLQDLDGGDGYVGTFQHVTSLWLDRWRTWGKWVGVKSGATNVLSQAVVSVRMAKALGTWNTAWAGCA